ncbi:alpha-amylase family glycosyl hydrolase [Brevundimonas subvibrioides]|uniref:alpha-amylase family glycosyl hydrolase n=1 Tax=Brevundimonas subvibrioides TaxID=74313 RepID=UPI0032D598F2
MSSEELVRANASEATGTGLSAVLSRLLHDLYDDRAIDLMGRVEARLRLAIDQRPESLRAIDRRRAADPAWIGRSGETVYTFYVDRFAVTLDGVIEKLDYLQSLGIRWLHPLPLLRARDGDSDGGFAVQNYREVEPALGDMATLERLTAELRARDMGLLLDVVCNHTAREHDWATRARAGEPTFRAYYHLVQTEAEVAAWERSLIDVFPDTAPGSFTYDEDIQAWVWTTFYPFQWDLNYANPDVFLEMLDVLLFLANRGVQGFRLDSAPFLWKRQGTSCRNQPEAYLIVEAFRAALSIAAPGVVLLAEAIESLDDVLPFFGEAADGCDLAYNNGVMTALWGGLADQNAGIVRRVLDAAAARPDHAAWLNYVRCHDDLIWNALAAYASPADLERWSRFYDGQGFSGGRRFQTAAGGVPSTNGMAAALVGLGRDDVDPALALARLVLLYGVIHALDGWPLIYMGDEIGLGNDLAYLDDPDRRDEGRWLHRPVMDWSRLAADDGDGPAARVFDAIKAFGDRARALNDLGVAGRAMPLAVEPASVLAFTRADGRPFLCLANLSDRRVSVARPIALDGPGLSVLTGEPVPGGPVQLAAYEVLWWVATS